MARYVGRIETSRSVEETFDYMADFSNVTAWDETTKQARVLQGPAAGVVGSRFAVKVRFAGRDTDLEYETKGSEPHRRLLLRAETATIVSEDEVTVARGSDGTTLLTYDADLRLRGPLKLLDPVLGLLFQRLGDNAAAGLARELDGRLLD
jgi:carbon monoxide dehydrogenase subunit G